MSNITPRITKRSVGYVPLKQTALTFNHVDVASPSEGISRNFSLTLFSFFFLQTLKRLSGRKCGEPRASHVARDFLPRRSYLWRNRRVLPSPPHALFAIHVGKGISREGKRLVRGHTVDDECKQNKYRPPPSLSHCSVFPMSHRRLSRAFRIPL